MSNKAKRRKTDSNDSNILLFRKELLKLIEEWEMDKLFDTSHDFFSVTYTFHKWRRYKNSKKKDLMELILKKNDSSSFRSLLVNKKGINNELNDIYTRYLLPIIRKKKLEKRVLSANDSKDSQDSQEEMNDASPSSSPHSPKPPSSQKDKIYHLVHYFYHGKIPHDQKLKSFQTLRKEESAILKSFNPNSLNRISITVDSKSIEFPKDLLFEILRFVPHNFKYLAQIGLTNEIFFISFLMTWESVIIKPSKLHQISILVLKSSHELVFQDNYSKYEEKSSILTVSNFQYLFSKIENTRIRSINLSNLENSISYKNFFSSILKMFPENSSVFSKVTKFKFPYSSFGKKNSKYEDCYRNKIAIYNFGIKLNHKNMKFCPNLRILENSPLEGIMLLNKSLIYKIEKFNFYLYRGDMAILEELGELGLEFENCASLEIISREELKSSYIETIFSKFKFSKEQLRCLKIGVSSSNDNLVLNHPSMENLETLCIDFSVNNSLGGGNLGIWLTGINQEATAVVSSNVSLENYCDCLKTLVVSSYPSTRGKLEFLESVKCDRIIIDVANCNPFLRQVDQPTLFNSWCCESAKFFQLNFHEFCGGTLSYTFVPEKQSIEISCNSLLDIRGEYFAKTLDNLSDSFLANNSHLKSYKFIDIKFSKVALNDMDRFKIIEFLKDNFYFCDFMDPKTVDSTKEELLRKGKQKQKNEDSEKNEVKKPFDGIKICISQIGNPGRSEIREMAIKLGAEYSPDWDDSVTHLIVPLGARRDVAKVESALDNKNTIIVCDDWVYICENEDVYIDEEDFKIDLTEEKKIKNRKKLHEKIWELEKLYYNKNANVFRFSLEIDHAKRTGKRKRKSIFSILGVWGQW